MICLYFLDKQFLLSRKACSLKKPTKKQSISSGSQITDFSLCFSILGQTSETVLLDFCGFKIGRLVSVCTFDPIAMSLAPSQPYVAPEKNFWNVPSSNSGQYTIVPGQKPDWG